MSTAVIRSMPDAKAIAAARLPESYERAKVALSECYSRDECKEWSDKAMALLAYARQAQDESLYKTAERIHGRAVKRMGELLKEFDARGAHRKKDGNGLSSQRNAASDVGLSERQQKQAVRVANVPDEEFEALIESDDPPTVTALAELGKKRREQTAIALEGRNPKDFAVATQGQGLVHYIVSESKQYDVLVVARGLREKERGPLLKQIEKAVTWLIDLDGAIQQEMKNGNDR